jgi:hypothetical protein
MRSKRHHYDPLRDLIANLRVAAAQITCANARRIAAREADRIPPSKTERAHGTKAKIAFMGRQQMRALPGLPRENWAEAADVMRNCADALDGRFELVSEIKLGERRRGDATLRL